VSTGAQRLAHFAALTLCLAAIAWASPLPARVTDRDVYEATAAHGVVLDCSDIHCFRVMVPWLLSPLPGPSILKWKAYAVLSNAAAGLAVFAFALFVIGSFAEDLRGFAGISQGVTRWLATGAAYIVPNFSALNVISSVAHSNPVPGQVILYNSAYALVYAAVAISGAVLVFEHRNLK